MDLKEAVLLVSEYGPMYRDGTHPAPVRGIKEFAEAAIVLLNHHTQTMAQRQVDQVSALTYSSVEEFPGQFEMESI